MNMRNLISGAEAVSSAIPAATALVAPGPENDRFIRESECRRLSGLSRATRWRLERDGRFPKRRPLSDNAVGWRLSDVLAWMDAR